MGLSIFTEETKWTLLPMAGSFVGGSVAAIMAGEEINGMFYAETYTEELSTSWAAIPVPKRSSPFNQWLRGNVKDVSFRASLYRDVTIKDRAEARDIMDDIKRLKASIEPDVNLGRPPSYTFVYGDIEFDCVVLSLGGIAYVELRFDGKVKGVTFDIVLRVIDLDNISMGTTDASKSDNLSRMMPVARGDTYETIASRVYGQAIFGVFLRQLYDGDGVTILNPKLFPGPGDIIHAPDHKHFIGKQLLAQSVALSNTIEAKAARQALLDEYAEEVMERPFIVEAS